MTSSTSSNRAFALLANLVFATSAAATAGCGTAFAEDPKADFPAGAEDTSLPQRDETTTTDAPKAPPVGGPADVSELTNALGVFVSPKGLPNAPGTRENPLDSIQRAIDIGKQTGKRVYVCSGTYLEALTLADSISVIGALDCSGGEWRTGGVRSRVESPSSPALRARDIRSPTRIEGLEVTAPNATTPSSSSIGLMAERAAALVIASSKITAGDAAKGDDGTESKPIVASGYPRGQDIIQPAQCNASGVCATSWSAQAAGGTISCDGVPAETGGRGGVGGLYQVVSNGEVPGTYKFTLYLNDPIYAAREGETRTGAAGAPGIDGASGGSIGSASFEGYLPKAGTAGGDGGPGRGGAGGRGRSIVGLLDANDARFPANSIWRGYGGAAGGAGGCAGRAGTPGNGGGASIAALLLESAMTFDETELASGRGGDPGRGTFGSDPTAGGLSGADVAALTGAQRGGAGGVPGISGNGSSGPSVGIMHVGAAPKVDSRSKIAPGSGGAAIPSRSRTYVTTKTIPATPAGVSKAILAL